MLKKILSLVLVLLIFLPVNALAYTVYYSTTHNPHYSTPSYGSDERVYLTQPYSSDSYKCYWVSSFERRCYKKDSKYRYYPSYYYTNYRHRDYRDRDCEGGFRCGILRLYLREFRDKLDERQEGWAEEREWREEQREVILTSWLDRLNEIRERWQENREWREEQREQVILDWEARRECYLKKCYSDSCYWHYNC